MEIIKTDILVVGTGAAGLYTALNIDNRKQALIISKHDANRSDSFLAQGGICSLRKDDGDEEIWLKDTLRAGHFKNSEKSIRIMIESSPEIINDLIDCGVEFQRDENGCLVYTREGAHSVPRILYHEDETGKEITSKLLEKAKNQNNITIKEHLTMLDIIYINNTCYGIIAAEDNGTLCVISADYTVWACGGLGGLYEHSTNYRHIKGDALAIAIKHGIALKNINYVQIHPTTFYRKNETDRSFLISESVRGEGALLYSQNMERFTNELLPRDLLTIEIRKQMEKDNSEFVWMDMSTISKEQIVNHFPHIFKHCLENGYNPLNECIPVTPAEHYLNGGVAVDTDSRTSCKRLYAVGETANNGIHGQNRLASNSLLESLVFAKRAAADIAKTFSAADRINIDENEILTKYSDVSAIKDLHKELVLNEIKKENGIYGQD